MYMSISINICLRPLRTLPPPLLTFSLLAISMVVSDNFLLCKAALVFAVTRCLLSFAHTLLNSISLFSFSSEALTRTLFKSSSSSSANLKMVQDSLTLTTFGDMTRRLPESHDTSCAVCLNRLRKKNEVWELRNCCHVFHKQCLERWLVYDSRLTCPLCRVSLLAVSPLPPSTLQLSSPSWAVERMLYLFGDDLLPCD
ncbi:probable E3 ubiquitin-protein ligase XERICO [Olea europaea var. sylvestris]|uniref:probable E3 ubiquitin-protein ligase XERICO n=1 Tax=Olea europaea var. sylvestris TaxID=158386 RepID=UPI000C1D59B0|nr:probable E3 ubiquitin-protein ligase XERICO [Olea europaea var. sylvestris]